DPKKLSRVQFITAHPRRWFTMAVRTIALTGAGAGLGGDFWLAVGLIRAASACRAKARRASVCRRSAYACSTRGQFLAFLHPYASGPSCVCIACRAPRLAAACLFPKSPAALLFSVRTQANSEWPI